MGRGLEDARLKSTDQVKFTVIAAFEFIEEWVGAILNGRSVFSVKGGILAFLVILIPRHEVKVSLSSLPSWFVFQRVQRRGTVEKSLKSEQVCHTDRDLISYGLG